MLEPPLRGGQLILSTTPPAGVVDMLGVAGGGETGDPDIDAGLAAGGRQRAGGHVITGKHQHPISPLAFDLDRFHPALHCTGHADLDLADAL